MLNATTTAGAQLRNLAIIVICIALLAGINVVFNDYIVRVISTIFIFMILAVSYNLINGVTAVAGAERLRGGGRLRDRPADPLQRQQGRHV
jgi:branched-chain amino acid transport system permease protein